MILSIVILTTFLLSLLSISLSTHLPSYFNKDYSNNSVFAQLNNNNNSIKTLVNDTWTSKRDNLYIFMKLEPSVPIIDQWTQMFFDIKELNSGKLDPYNLTVNTTISDHDGRLFKFPEQKVTNGRFNISYIFPDDGQHRVILQLYKDNRAFTVANFDVNVPHPQEPKSIFEQLFQARPY